MPVKHRLPEWERQDNKKKVLSKIIEKPLRFEELLKETKLSRSTLTQHLKDLRKNNEIEKAVKNNKVIYKPTQKTLELPIFEIFAYHKMVKELFKFGEPLHFIFKTEPTGKDRESAYYWDLDPAYLKGKSETELLKAFDKWLSPIVLGSVLQEIKTGKEWTEAVQGIVKRIRNLVKQKDIGKFEEALKALYVDRFNGFQIVLEKVEREKLIHAHFDELFSKIEVLKDG